MCSCVEVVCSRIENLQVGVYQEYDEHFQYALCTSMELNSEGVQHEKNTFLFMSIEQYGDGAEYV
jgi:hypothetical protein